MPVDPLGLFSSSFFFGMGGTVEQLSAILVSSPEYVKNSGVTSNDSYLKSLYLDVFSRDIDPLGRFAWNTVMATGVAPFQVASAIFASNEYRLNLLERAFSHFLYRTPDPFGLNSFAAAMANGMSDRALIAILAGSDEYYRNVG